MLVIDKTALTWEIFRSSANVRYVALYVEGELTSAVRPGISYGTASESDKYEELLVNPTLLKLVEQRGAIDCGGMEFVLIRYGNFFQLVQPVPGGHVSVAIEATPNIMADVAGIGKLLDSRG